MKTKTKRVYVCDVCGKEHLTRVACACCESSHIDPEKVVIRLFFNSVEVSFNWTVTRGLTPWLKNHTILDAVYRDYEGSFGNPVIKWYIVTTADNEEAARRNVLEAALSYFKSSLYALGCDEVTIKGPSQSPKDIKNENCRKDF